MKKTLICLLLLIINITPFHSTASDFERILSICSSLNNYQSNYSMCINNGFAYPELEVEYFTSANEKVLLKVRQAKLSSNLFDSHIEHATIYCTSCDNGGSASAMLRVAEGLTSVVVNNSEVKVRNATSKSNGVIETARQVFAGIATNVGSKIGQDLLEDKQDSSRSNNTYIVVTDKNDNPKGSGYIKNGSVVLTIELHPTDKEGEYGWTGGLNRQEYYDATSNNAWGRFTASGKCEIRYTGTNQNMVAQVVCWYN